jgi:hypothetical protein
MLLFINKFDERTRNSIWLYDADRIDIATSVKEVHIKYERRGCGADYFLSFTIFDIFHWRTEGRWFADKYEWTKYFCEWNAG